MSAEPIPLPRYTYDYNADAYVLEADIQQPITNQVPQQALLSLPKEGGYLFKEVGPFKLQGVLSYTYGSTQVAGHRSTKGHGFTTLATSVIEGLNVLDVVTADRVVAQISTDNPDNEEQVPTVTFLGTRFVNLRIAGHKVEVDQDIHVLGPKPKKDVSYFEDSGSLFRMSRQFGHIRGMRDLPDWAAEEFARDAEATERDNKAQLSLVNNIHGAPGTAFGHVIDLPHFGKIYRGEVTITRKCTTPTSTMKDQYDFNLKMVRIDMGCIGTGSTNAGAVDPNGQGKG
jgi:hypothetical protein